MGIFGRRRKRKGELWVRPDYQDLPPDEWTDDERRHHVATMSDEEYWAQWEAWSRGTVEHPRIKRVRRVCLEMACEAARSSHPNEFASLLRAEKGTITELILLPGTIQGDEHAIFQMGMQPADRTIRGTLHSHPSPHPYPSDADFELFSAHGEIHIIIGTPYDMGSWRAYSHEGHPVRLEVVP